MKIENTEEFRCEIYELRKKHKISGSALSELINKGRAYVSQIERGAVKKIPKENVIEILNIFKLSKEEIALFINKYKNEDENFDEYDETPLKCYCFKFKTEDEIIELITNGVNRNMAFMKAIIIFNNKYQEKEWIDIYSEKISDNFYL